MVYHGNVKKKNHKRFFFLHYVNLEPTNKKDIQYTVSQSAKVHSKHHIKNAK